MMEILIPVVDVFDVVEIEVVAVEVVTIEVVAIVVVAIVVVAIVVVHLGIGYTSCMYNKLLLQLLRTVPLHQSEQQIGFCRFLASHSDCVLLPSSFPCCCCFSGLLVLLLLLG